jgi:hypothetical protein
VKPTIPRPWRLLCAVALAAGGCGGGGTTTIITSETTTVTRAAQSILIEDPLGRRTSQPPRFEFAANGDLVATQLQWSDWGSPTATGHAVFLFSPAPHATTTQVPGTLTVGGIRQCRGEAYYTTVQLAFERTPPFQPQVRLSTPCG